MPLLEITLDLKVDGKSVIGQPLVYSATVTQATSTQLTKSGADGASYVQWSQLATDNDIFLMADQAVNFKFNNAGAVALNAGGVILILNSNIASGAATNITINNNSGSTANVKTLEATT